MKNNFFEVLRPGINTTFQDHGRFNLQHFGVAPSGCMDYESFTVANALVSNDKTEGVLEFAYQGPLLKLIKGQTKFAITGRVHFQIINSKKETIDGECNRTYDLDEGEQIDILATNKTVYGYFAIEGGFSISPFCNSASTLTRANIGPNEGKKINIKNKIFFKKNRQEKNNYIIHAPGKNNNLIRVLKGPQHDYFSNSSKNDFCSKTYKISRLTDRMGMRLEGIVLKNVVSTNIRSEGIIKGSIQVPADGQPIILLNDHPTIGGYPKIANVISADYDLLVQNVPDTNLLFKYIELEEAEKAFKLYSENIKKNFKNKIYYKMKFLYKIPGPILCVMGAFFLSYGGLLVKSFEGSDLWQILLYRSIFCFLTVGVFLFFAYKKETIKRFKVSGFPGLLAGFFISLGFTAYVFAMYNTTVANVNFTITTQTIFLAIFGYIFLKEKIAVHTLISIILAMSGVLLMIGNSLTTGGFLGNIVALTMPISFAVLIIIVRKYPHVDMVPAMFVAAFLSAIYASFLVNSFYISPKDLFLSFLLGTFQIGFGFICITIGSKNTPAAIVGILMLVEAILGPVWAWIFINESPPLIVIIGGAIIMFSILFQSIFARKRN